MTSRIATRSMFAAIASLTVITPLAGCTSTTPTTPVSSAPTTSDVGSGSPGTGTAPDTATASSASEYADGTYTVRGVYGGAPSYMTITLTLEGGAIEEVAVEPMPENNDTSRGYQERFAAAVPDEVEGRPIDDLQVGVIAGASGCADGFNDALAKIREEATTNQ